MNGYQPQDARRSLALQYSPGHADGAQSFGQQPKGDSQPVSQRISAGHRITDSIQQDNEPHALPEEQVARGSGVAIGDGGLLRCQYDERAPDKTLQCGCPQADPHPRRGLSDSGDHFSSASRHSRRPG
jgi:hypothetical protein